MRRCRNNIAAGDLPHAAFHLGQAIAHDPAASSGYDVLGELVVAAGSSEAARELLKGDGTGVFTGNAAAIIALLAGEGQVSTAIVLLGRLVASDPVKPWAAAPWFSPALAATVPGKSIGQAVSAVWRVVDSPASPETARALAPWLDLARAVAARPDPDPVVLGALSALARRLGANQDALAWCLAAETIETRSGGPATLATLTMLGYAYCAAGQPLPAIEAWKRAAVLQPENREVLLDLSDLTFDQGDFDQARHWAERAAAIDDSALKPRAAVLAARFRASARDGLTGDSAPLVELVDLARAHPDVPYLRGRVSQACEGSTWLQGVPTPTEAVAKSFGEMAAIEESGQGRVVGSRGIMSTLEAPSAVSALLARFPQSTFDVPHVREPDMRIPVSTDFGPPLWTYRGTEAVPSAAPPSPQAVECLYQIAEGIWADPLVAYDRAAGLGGLDDSDLLGLLAHVPPPRAQSWKAAQRTHPLYWQRLAQVWVCVGILHHRPDEPWADSTRRTLLLRLLNGPEDWTVDAAAFALCVSAWHFPEQRPEIAEAITQRYLHAAKAVGKRPTELHNPLACVLLICPAVDPNVTRRARQAIAKKQEMAAAGDTEQVKESLLRIWKQRKGR